MVSNVSCTSKPATLTCRGCGAGLRVVRVLKHSTLSYSEVGTFYSIYRYIHVHVVVTVVFVVGIVVFVVEVTTSDVRL